MANISLESRNGQLLPALRARFTGIRTQAGAYACIGSSSVDALIMHAGIISSHLPSCFIKTICMAFHSQNICQRIAHKIVQPAIEAIVQIKRGKINSKAIGVLSTQTAIAELARMMGLKVPTECEQLNRICRDLNRALREQLNIEVEHDDVLIAEHWLILLREQLGRAKKQELSELVDRLVLAVGASKEYAVGE